MSTQFTIGPNGPTSGSALQAIYQPGRAHDPITIYNTGPDICYVDDENPLNSSQGQPLPNGSSLPWDEDRPLYIVCPTSTGITISANTQVGFDAGAVAAQLIDQGLAQDIANAISITGAPPIDNLALLTTVTLTNGQSSAILDTSAYQSVQIVMGPSIPNSNTRVELEWLDSTAAVILALDEPFCGTSGPSTSNTFAGFICRGPRLQLNANITTGNSVTVRVYGSYKSLSNNSWLGNGAGALSGGQLDGSVYYNFQTWHFSIPVGATWITSFGSMAGEHQLTMRYTNTSTESRIFRVPLNIFNNATTYAGESGAATTNGLTTTENIFLPPCPVELSLHNLHATNTLDGHATLVAARPFST